MSMDNVAMNRRDEIGRTPARSDRLFTQYDYWYFRTRESMNVGPFDSITEATDGIRAYIEFVRTATPETVTRISEYVSQAA